VKDVVDEFRKEHNLQDKPLFFTGCSCEGGAGGWAWVEGQDLAWTHV